MNYLFFDLEFASCYGGKSKICEFGYVVTNEKYNVLKRGNYIIDPNIYRNDWDPVALGSILTRDRKVYESSPRFTDYYENIRKLIKNADYIIGHSISGDAKALNDDCTRYSLESIDYSFYDVKNIYKGYTSSDVATSVENILKELNIEGENSLHDAETDAYNTMLILKKLEEVIEKPFQQIVELYPECRDETKNFIIESIEKARELKKERIEEMCSNSEDNTFKNNKYKSFFRAFTKKVKPHVINGKLRNKKYSVSGHYTESHRRQAFALVQLVVDMGGRYEITIKNTDVYVRFDRDESDKEKTLKIDKFNVKGNKIEVISFEEFLKRLELSETELDNLEMPNLECLYTESDDDEKPTTANRKKDDGLSVSISELISYDRKKNNKK